MVMVFDALPYPEQALTDSQHSAVGRYLLVEHWELALERAELLLAACRAADGAGDDLDTSTESDNARPGLAREAWHSAAPADLETTFDEWFNWRPEELFQSLHALSRMLRDHYETLLGEDDDQRFATHLRLHAQTTRH